MRRKQFSSMIRRGLRNSLEETYEEERHIRRKLATPEEYDWAIGDVVPLRGCKDLDFEITYYEDKFELVTNLMEATRVQIKKYVK